MNSYVFLGEACRVRGNETLFSKPLMNNCCIVALEMPQKVKFLLTLICYCFLFQESLCKEMLKQLKFAISCRSFTMPVKGAKTPEIDSNGGDYRISTLPSFTSDF